MNENIEKVLAVLDGFRMSDEMTYSAYSALHDEISLLDDLLKTQEPHKKGYWKYPQSLDCCCSECGGQPECEPGSSIPLYDYCPYCGAEMTVKWGEPPKEG